MVANLFANSGASFFGSTWPFTVANKQRALGELLAHTHVGRMADKWRPGWRTERIEHFGAAQWHEAADDLGNEAYWLSLGDYGTRAAAARAATSGGRLRLQAGDALVTGPPALELLDDL